MKSLETAFFYIAIGLAILLPFGILKYTLREKYAASIYRHPEAKRRILGSRRWLVPLLRIFLWLSPLYLILIPLLLYEYSDQNGITAFACMALIIANVFVEYRFQKWLYLYLIIMES